MNMNMTMTITIPTTSSCLMTAAITSSCPMPPRHVKTAVAAASTLSPSYNNAQMMTTNWGLATHLRLESPGAFILLQDDQGGTGLRMHLHLKS